MLKDVLKILNLFTETFWVILLIQLIQSLHMLLLWLIKTKMFFSKVRTVYGGAYMMKKQIKAA